MRGSQCERLALECSQALISPFTGRPGGHSYISSDTQVVRALEREWSEWFESHKQQTTVVAQDNSLATMSLNLLKVNPKWNHNFQKSPSKKLSHRLSLQVVPLVLTSPVLYQTYNGPVRPKEEKWKRQKDVRSVGQNLIRPHVYRAPRP